MDRRSFLTGMAGILAASTAPWVHGTVSKAGLLLPVRKVLTPLDLGPGLDTQTVPISGLSGKIWVRAGTNDWGSEDGTFERPFKTLAAAAASAKSGDTILVVPGTYRNESVILPAGDVSIMADPSQEGRANIINSSFQSRKGGSIYFHGLSFDTPTFLNPKD